MEKDILKGKRCLITGASGGIGRQFALQLAGCGCHLFLTGRNSGKLADLKQEILDLSDTTEIYFCTGDFTAAGDTAKIIRMARETLKEIDILINSAGIFPVQSLEESTDQQFDECFQVNVKAAFVLCREFSKDMVKNRWGRIVNIASSSAYSGFAETSIYCASKHALLGLSRSLHKELKKHNVRTFCISPAAVKTEMGRSIRNLDFETFIDPADVARCAIDLITFDHNMVPEEVRLNRMSSP